MPEQYEDDHANATANLKDSTCTPCEKLDELRASIVDLKQQKNKYWRRPCLRDWPCLFTQHRANIDEKLEQLNPVEKRLARECSMFMQKKIVEDTIKSTEQKTDSTNGNANRNSLVNVQGDHVTHVHLPEAPKP